MRRVSYSLAAIAVLHLPIHPKGPGIDYVGVLAASVASWAGLPGPGEAALVAASVSAGQHHLNITAILAVAWIGATAGGMAGWIVGVRAGRGAMTRPGPFHHLRLSIIEKGDRFYERYGLVAVLFTPSWVAGIHHMRLSRYGPVNLVSALVWALAWGLLAYFVGPSITDVISDAGTARWFLAAGAVVAIATIAVMRRSRHRG